MIYTLLSILFSSILYRIIVSSSPPIFNPSFMKAIIDFNRLFNELFIRDGDIVYYIILYCVFEAFITY